MAISDYTKLVTSKHWDKPKFVAWLNAILSPTQDAIDLVDNIYIDFGISSAVGSQLDVLGEAIGVSRNLTFQPSVASPTLDDTTYRFVLKAKIAQNLWDGTIPGLYSIWASVFPTASIRIVDNQDMSSDMQFVGQSFTILERELIANNYIIPKTQCVSVLKTFGGTFSFRSVALTGGAYVIESDTPAWNDGITWNDSLTWDENNTGGFSNVSQVSGGYFGSVS